MGTSRDREIAIAQMAVGFPDIPFCAIIDLIDKRIKVNQVDQSVEFFWDKPLGDYDDYVIAKKERKNRSIQELESLIEKFQEKEAEAEELKLWEDRDTFRRKIKSLESSIESLQESIKEEKKKNYILAKDYI